MRLLIEDEGVADSPAIRLLRLLATRSPIEVYSTQGSTPLNAYVETTGGQDGGTVCVERGEDEWTRSFVWGLNDDRERARREAARTGEAADSIFSRLVLGTHWREKPDLDAIVSEDGLLADGVRHGTSLFVQRPETALAEVGLCLRAHGDFVVERSESGGTGTMTNSFYLGAADAFLPLYRDWYGAAFTAWHERRDPRPLVLLKSLFTRLARALRALDFVRVRRMHPRLDDAWGELLFFFDSLLVALDGTLDCLARFLHVAFDVPGEERWASWDKFEWRRAVTKSLPELSALSSKYSGLANTAVAIARLRNTVHGEVLSSDVYHWDETAAVSDFGAGKLLITGRDAHDVETACARLGLDRLTETRQDAPVEPAVLVSPDVYACAMTREVIDCLTAVLSTVSVDRLAMPPQGLDLSHEFSPVELQKNIALLAAIPPNGDRYFDALVVPIRGDKAISSMP